MEYSEQDLMPKCTSAKNGERSKPVASFIPQTVVNRKLSLKLG